MNLFKKEKGIVLAALNAVLVIWVLASIIIVISNVTNMLLKEYVYTYDEYRLTNCDFQYETEEECKNSYAIYKLDMKNYRLSYPRNIIIGISSCVLVSGVLYFLNKEKENK